MVRSWLCWRTKSSPSGRLLAGDWGAVGVPVDSGTKAPPPGRVPMICGAVSMALVRTSLYCVWLRSFDVGESLCWMVRPSVPISDLVRSSVKP
jgi:hypothetical protein